MNSINIPRYCNGNLVYDAIPYNNIITVGTNEYNCINITNGILVNDNGSTTLLKTSGFPQTGHNGSFSSLSLHSPLKYPSI